MARIKSEPDGVFIELSWPDKVLALSGSLRIPYAHIAEVHADPVPRAWYRGMRIGTNLPGIKVAGTFVNEDGIIFYDFRDPNRCVTFILSHDRYTKVVVEVDLDHDPKSLSLDIRRRLVEKP